MASKHSIRLVSTIRLITSTIPRTLFLRWTGAMPISTQWICCLKRSSNCLVNSRISNKQLLLKSTALSRITTIWQTGSLKYTTKTNRRKLDLLKWNKTFRLALSAKKVSLAMSLLNLISDLSFCLLACDWIKKLLFENNDWFLDQRKQTKIQSCA